MNHEQNNSQVVLLTDMGIQMDTLRACLDVYYHERRTMRLNLVIAKTLDVAHARDDQDTMERSEIGPGIPPCAIYLALVYFVHVQVTPNLTRDPASDVCW